MIQKFIPEVKEGDKRIIIIDGEPIGCVNRIPSKSEIRANMHVGAKAVKSSLSKNEKKICSIIAPELIKRELLLVGIDIIGERYLTEINVTSPTGLQEINFFDKISSEKYIWDIIEAKYAKRLNFS